MYRSTPYDVQSVTPHKPQSFVETDTEKRFPGMTPRSNGLGHLYRSSGMLQTTDDASDAYISRTLYICKLPPDFTASQISEVLSPFGDIRKITCYPSRQIAFAEFWDLRDAQKARNGLKDVQIGGRQVEIQYSKTRDDRSKEKNTGTLYVRPITTERNFRDPNTLQQYKELFNHYGEVKKVNTNRKREAEKFIEYHDLRSAEAALENLNGMNFNGVKLEVQFANQSSKTITSGSSSHRSMRGDSGQNVNNLSHPINYTPEVRSASTSPYWTGPPIKIHWNGTYGPRAILSSTSAADCNSSALRAGNDSQLRLSEGSGGTRVVTTDSTTFRCSVENAAPATPSSHNTTAATTEAAVVQMNTSNLHTTTLGEGIPSPSCTSSFSSNSSVFHISYSSQHSTCYPLTMSSPSHYSEKWIPHSNDAPRSQC